MLRMSLVLKNCPTSVRKQHRNKFTGCNCSKRDWPWESKLLLNHPVKVIQHKYYITLETSCSVQPFGQIKNGQVSGRLAGQQNQQKPENLKTILILNSILISRKSERSYPWLYHNIWNPNIIILHTLQHILAARSLEYLGYVSLHQACEVAKMYCKYGKILLTLELLLFFPQKKFGIS